MIPKLVASWKSVLMTQIASLIYYKSQTKQRDKHTTYYHSHKKNNKKERDYRYSKNTQVSKYGFKFTIMLAFSQESIEDTKVTSCLINGGKISI